MRGRTAGFTLAVAVVAAIDATGGPHTPDLPWWVDAAAAVVFAAAWLRCEVRAARPTQEERTDGD